MSDSQDTCDDFIDRAEELPPAPRILLDLLTVLRQERDTDAGALVDLIRLDPVLTSRVLQVCNSAAAGHAGRITSVQQAVVQIGFNPLFQVVASMVCSGVLRAPQPGYGLRAGELWKRSVIGALAGGALAETREADAALIFTAALLRDLGKLVLGRALQDQLTVSFLPTVEIPEDAFLQLERTMLGVDHALVGARLLERWGLPAALVNAVRYHHAPLALGSSELLPCYVHAADIAASILATVNQPHLQLAGNREALRWLGFNEEQFTHFIARTQNLVWQTPLLRAA